MEAQGKAVYENLELESGDMGSAVGSASETTTSAFEHNDGIGYQDHWLPTALEPGQPRVCEPATNMADEQFQETTETANHATSQSDRALTDALMGKTYEEKTLLAELWQNLHDLLFPPKLPPLELTSKPIPVPDRMATRTNPVAVGFSAVINLLIIAVVLYFGVRKAIQVVQEKKLAETDVTVSQFLGPKSAQRAGGGGGGGDHSPVEASKGRLPKIEQNPVTPPMIPKIDHPKIEMEPAINIQKDIHMDDNPALPMIGLKNSANVTLASNGQGSGAGMGTGRGGGLGAGSGNGLGTGTGGGTGGGLYHLGAGDTAPSIVYSVDPEFSDEARRNKFQGICLVTLIVNEHGDPVNPHVVRPLGMGLDENAIAAVKKYKFRPAMKGGRIPVAMQITIEVNFRLY